MNGLSTNRRHWHNHRRHHHHGVIDMVPDKAKVLQEVDDIQAVKNAIPVAKANLDKAADDLSVARLAAAGAQTDHDAAAKALDDAVLAVTTQLSYSVQVITAFANQTDLDPSLVDPTPDPIPPGATN